MKNMKKISLALFIAFATLTSCSDDDNSPSTNYQISLGIDCDTPDPRVKHCVTKSEYDRTYELRNNPCEIITITDINGNTHSGVPNGWSFSAEGQDCN